MTRSWLSIFRFTLLGGLVGLPAGCQHLEKPNLLHPGSEQTQQARALRYDPYPETSIGPTVDGSRPRNYDLGTPETERARWTLGNWQ
jgi:hypothetical protein